MYRLIKNEKPQIIHTHTPKAGMLGMIAGWMARVPIRLHTVAGLPLMETRGFKRLVLDFVEKLTYSYATMVYPNSFGLRDFILQQKFCSPDKLKVLCNGSSNGIDLNFFSPAEVSPETKYSLKTKLNISPTHFVFVFVGRLVRDKGINEMVSAFEKLDVTRQKLKLILVGTFEEYLDPLLPETIKSIHENPDIISVGNQSDVRPWLAISDALVFPSYREGFPNVVMQAGAMGLPSIVTDINGCNEIIIPGKNGEIIPPKNEKALHDKMSEWIDNPEKIANMTRNSRKLIEDRFDQKNVWNELLMEYNRLLT